MAKQKQLNYNSEIFENPAVGRRYVYFSNLLNLPHQSPYYKLGLQAQSYLNSAGASILNTNSETGKSQGKILASLNFLKQAAEFERSKEIQFFSNYRSKYNDVLDNFKFDSISNNNFDYQSFIADINIAMKGLSSFKSEVKGELDRINRMRAADEAVRKAIKDTKDMSKEMKEQYLNDIKTQAMTAGGTKAYAGGSEAFYLKRASDDTMKGLAKNGTLNAEIAEIVINTYGTSLFELQGGKLRLNATRLSTLIKVISDKVYAEFINKYQTAKRSEERHTQLTNIAISPEVKEYVERLMSNKSLEAALDSIAQQHGLYDKTISEASANAEEMKAIEEKLKSGYNHMCTTNMPTFEEWRKKHPELDIERMAQATNVVKAQSYYTGEDISLMTFIAAGLGGILGGNANPTDDFEAGQLVIDTSIDDSQFSSLIKRTDRELDKLQEQYFNEITKTANLEDFQNNTRKLRELREKQEKILKRVNDKISKTDGAANYLLSHMNIHGTVKGYQSAGRDNFEFYGGFEGAAFGSSLDAQLSILTSSAGSGLLGSAGISTEDKQWLRFAMINAGAQMLGAHLKPTIENYFSIFVGFFMFNDAALMIEDAANYMKDQYTVGAQDLHLYQLNGLIVPSSYMLQKTYESLLPLTNDINANLNTTQSTRAILHTYNGGPVGNDWEATTNTAVTATKLEMKFLAGFLDLLQSISDKISNL